MEQFTNNAATILNGTITSGATSLVVTSAVVFPTSGNFRILVDSEIMLVTGVSGTTFTITRGQENTSATSHTNGVPVTHIITAGGLAQTINDNVGFPSTPGLRLSLSTGTPITTTDVTGATTLYYTPYTSGNINLFNGTIWTPYNTGEVSLALGTLSNATNYDVFATYSSGVVLHVLAWSSNTARATALVRQNGALVLSGTTSYLYIGTFRTTSTTTTEDSLLNRFVWNQYNQQPRQFLVQDTTASWTYNSVNFREARGVTTNNWSYVTGDAGTRLYASSACAATQSGNPLGVGVGIDSTSTNSAQILQNGTGATAAQAFRSEYRGYPGLGYHNIVWLETGSSSTATFYGTSSVFGGGQTDQSQAGMIGELQG